MAFSGFRGESDFKGYCLSSILLVLVVTWLWWLLASVAFVASGFGGFWLLVAFGGFCGEGDFKGDFL